MTLTARYRVKPGSRLSLARQNPADTAGLTDKRAAEARADELRDRLGDLQDRLYATDRWSVLLIFQAMDGAGKDSTIKHVMSGVNPQGCQVFAFKAPSDEELDHDYLWRSARALPERGRIGVHNRSHYEEVIVTRVHPEILARQRVPDWPPPARMWRQRFRQINEWERHLAENGTVILKFFLNISKEEQAKRFLKRLEEPEKHWKFSPKDVRERDFWDAYMAAYQDVLRATSTDWAPWFVIPADNKWFMRLAVADIICQAMDGLKLRYPTVPPATMREWEEMKQLLRAR
jgi:PPK2 family polyphosphate:nucleotide phosphotransferase